LHLLKVARILNLGAVAQHRERRQTYVNADSLVVCWQRLRLDYTTETRIPKAVLTLDGESLNLALNLSMLLDFHRADFREL
jgi:hypothetical protein